MDWTTIIITLMTSGVFLSVLYYRENRRSKQIDNEKSVVEEWRGFAEERKARFDALYKENSELRKRNDKLSSANAALSILKCKVLGCDKRQPPFGKNENCES